MRKRAVDDAGRLVPNGPMNHASEEPEHDQRVERKTREQMMEELALEYFRFVEPAVVRAVLTSALRLRRNTHGNIL